MLLLISTTFSHCLVVTGRYKDTRIYRIYNLELLVASMCVINSVDPYVLKSNYYINIMAYNHAIKLVNTPAIILWPWPSMWTIENKYLSLNSVQSCSKVRSNIIYKKYMPRLYMDKYVWWLHWYVAGYLCP